MTDIYFDPTGINMSGMVDGQTIDPEDVTTPLTELIAAIQDMDTNLDTDISDHETRLLGLEAIGPTAKVDFDNLSTDYQTNVTTWQLVDATNLVLSLTTTGGDVLVHFHGVVAAPGIHTDGWYTMLMFNLQHTDPQSQVSYIAPGYGIMQVADQDIYAGIPVSFTRLIRNLAAGTHTFKLAWKTNGASTNMGRLYVNGRNGQFWAKEVY